MLVWFVYKNGKLFAQNVIYTVHIWNSKGSSNGGQQVHLLLKLRESFPFTSSKTLENLT